MLLRKKEFVEREGFLRSKIFRFNNLGHIIKKKAFWKRFIQLKDGYEHLQPCMQTLNTETVKLGAFEFMPGIVLIRCILQS